MNTKIQTFDICDFPVGTTVDIIIDGQDSDWKGVVITRVSPSGVEINGETIISCKSPAVLSETQRGVKVDTDSKTGKQTVTIERLPIESRPKRKRVAGDDASNEFGKYQEIINNLNFPAGSFTIGTLAEVNELPYHVAAKYCKEYLTEDGVEVKAPGQRGKSATLYKIE